MKKSFTSLIFAFQPWWLKNKLKASYKYKWKFKPFSVSIIVLPCLLNKFGPVWFQCCPSYLSRKKGISGTFLSLGLRPRLQKFFPRFPLFYFTNLDTTSIRQGQILFFYVIKLLIVFCFDNCAAKSSDKFVLV